MKFHAKKCKVLSVNHFGKNLFSELPFFLFPYHINNSLLEYSEEEKDLGIYITNRFSFTNHHNEILNKAIKQFHLLRRTCHFVNNSHQRRTLYLTLIRSLFEHDLQVWSPISTAKMLRFENFQKSCVKWILREQFKSYQEKEYLTKLRSLNIFPLEYKFILSDLLIFHKIVFELIPIELPSEIVPLVARTRSSTSVSYKFQIKNDISNKKKVFSNSFLSRAIHYWNRLPDDVRNISQFSQFKSSVIQ